MRGVALKVLIDARMVGPIPHGFARYVTRLAAGLQGLRVQGELPYEPLFLVSPEFPGDTFQGFAIERLETPFLHPSELLTIPRVLRRLDAALYHSPTFSSLLTCPCPWIVTVHDLNHLTYAGVLKKAYYRLILRPFMRQAKALLTVSEFSRREISAWAGVPEARIEVVYNALEPRLFEPVSDADIERALAKHGLKRGKYFFCLSNPKPHKNVGLLVEAFRRYREGCSEPWDLALSFQAYGDVSGVRPLGGVGDHDALALLAGAGAVAFPSLYEGFGLPPVESAALGRPVLVSRIPPHEEALRDLAPDEVVWVDPRDVGGWAAALLQAQRGEVQGARPETREKIRIRYSEARIGAHMDQIYRRVLRIDS